MVRHGAARLHVMERFLWHPRGKSVKLVDMSKLMGRLLDAQDAVKPSNLTMPRGTRASAPVVEQRVAQVRAWLVDGRGRAEILRMMQRGYELDGAQKPGWKCGERTRHRYYAAARAQLREDRSDR